MRILNISTGDSQGGASIAVYRLHKALINIGVDSTMLVAKKSTMDSNVLLSGSRRSSKIKFAIHFQIDQVISSFFRHTNNHYFSPAISGHRKIIEIANHYDLIQLNWINSGFVTPKIISKINKRIVWRLSDMWPFTGGCHYSGGCIKYHKFCSECPIATPKYGIDIAKYAYNKKIKYYNSDIVIVSPSHWLSDCARDSNLFKNNKVVVIPTGVDELIYKPIEKRLAKDILGVSNDKKVILFGSQLASSDFRKGIHLFKESLKSIGEKYKKDVDILVFGSGSDDEEIEGYTIKYLGYLSDDISKAIVYSAADLFVAPSLEENLPNTALESMACGTPVVSFNIGGFPDLITHNVDGYLASPFDVDDLARGIEVLLDNYDRFSINSRNKILSNFTLKRQAEQYSELYVSIA